MTPEPPSINRPPTALPDVLWPLFLAVLRARGHVTFMLGDLGDDCGRVCFDTSIIVLDRGNDDAAMRSTVAHELEHLDCPDCPEEEIEAMTARLLVPLPDALAAAQLYGGTRAIADRLGVDPQLVQTRIESLYQQEGSAGGVG